MKPIHYSMKTQTAKKIAERNYQVAKAFLSALEKELSGSIE
jgi:HD superfamily phosphodiesterase